MKNLTLSGQLLLTHTHTPTDFEEREKKKLFGSSSSSLFPIIK